MIYKDFLPFFLFLIPHFLLNFFLALSVKFLFSPLLDLKRKEEKSTLKQYVYIDISEVLSNAGANF